MGLYWYDVTCMFWIVGFALFAVVPWYLGFTWVRLDANWRGQPGWLWAFVTIPLGWVAILAYLVTRGIAQPRA